MTPFPNPEAQAAVEAFEARRRSGAASVAGALAQRDAEAEERHDTGMIVPIAVGCTVWTNPEKLRGEDDEIAQQTGAMSGIVLGQYVRVEHNAEVPIVRVYNMFTPRPDKRFQQWDESSLDPWRTQITPVHKMARYWRRLHRLIAEGDGLPSEQEATIAADAQRLLRVLMVTGGRR